MRDSPLWSVVGRAFRRPASRLGAAIIALFLAIGTAAPWLAPPEKPCPSLAWYLVPDVFLLAMPSAPCKPFTMPRDGVGNKPTPPDFTAWAHFPPDWRRHPLGTTQLRYDLYYGMVWGARSALGGGVLVVAVIYLIGLLVGGTAGYYGGWVDGLAMRAVDFMTALPFELAILALVAILGPGLDKILFALVLLGWPGYARFLRGIALSLREREYLVAARALGASDGYIFRRHVLPELLASSVVLLCMNLGAVVGMLAGFSFLGLGAGAAYADWGNLIALSRDRVIGAAGGSALTWWYTLVFPAGAIFLLVLGWNLLGDGLRDAADPRAQRR